MGHQPTGILIRAAKANGHSSVSELIQKKGVNNLEMYKAAASPKKLLSPKKPADLNKVPCSCCRLEQWKCASLLFCLCVYKPLVIF